MSGIVFVAGLIACITFVGIRSRQAQAAPGVLLTLALAAGSIWFVFG